MKMCVLLAWARMRRIRGHRRVSRVAMTSRATARSRGVIGAYAWPLFGRGSKKLRPRGLFLASWVANRAGTGEQEMTTKRRH